MEKQMTMENCSETVKMITEGMNECFELDKKCPRIYCIMVQTKNKWNEWNKEWNNEWNYDEILNKIMCDVSAKHV